MARDLFAVTGATGNTGSGIASRLLERGHAVRAIGRDAARLRGLADLGAESWVGSADDSAFLSRAFAGAKAVYAMIPPNNAAEDFGAYQDRLGEATVEAIGAAGVTHAVHLSSLGAHLAEGTGPIKGLHRQERRLGMVPGLNVVHLRPTFFFENLLANVGSIRAMGVAGGPARPDVAAPMIATRDIASVAADLLEEAGFAGSSVRELHGPAEYTHARAAGILGRSIGRPDLPYVQFSYDDTRAALAGAGLSESVADLVVEMYRGLNDGLIVPTQARTPLTTTPTTLEVWAEEVFAPAFAAAGG